MKNFLHSIPTIYIGYFCAFVCAFGYGILPVLAKLYYEGGGNVATFLFLRSVSVALIASPIIAILMKQSLILDRANFKKVHFLSFINLILWLAYYQAVDHIDVSLMIIIFFTYPIVTVLIEFKVKGDDVSYRQVQGMLIAFVGLILVVGPDFNIAEMWGIFLAALSALCMGSNLVVQRQIVQNIAQPVYSTHWGLFFFFPVTGYMLYVGWQPGPWHIMAIVIVISVCTGLATGYALKFIGSVKFSNVNNLEPIFAIFLATVLANESMETIQYVGAGIVVASLYLVHRKKRSIET